MFLYFECNSESLYSVIIVGHHNICESRQYKGSVMPTYRLDSVANAKDELMLLSHAIDKLHGNEASVIGTGELSCGTIQSPSKPVPLWEGVKYD